MLINRIIKRISYFHVFKNKNKIIIIIKLTKSKRTTYANIKLIEVYFL